MQFVHISLNAKDWRKLSEFYTKVFDCRPKPPKRELSGRWLEKATGLKDAKIEGIHLVLPGHQKFLPTLEIFTYSVMVDSKQKEPNRRGFAHIAFEVRSVKNTLSLAIRNGGKKLGEIVKKEIKAVGEIEFAYFYDPEDNIVEIQSWNKVK